MSHSEVFMGDEKDRAMVLEVIDVSARPHRRAFNPSLHAY